MVSVKGTSLIMCLSTLKAPPSLGSLASFDRSSETFPVYSRTAVSHLNPAARTVGLVAKAGKVAPMKIRAN